MKNGQTPKSPARKKLDSYHRIMSLFKLIINYLFFEPVRVQIVASVVFILAIAVAIGVSHG